MVGKWEGNKLQACFLEKCLPEALSNCVCSLYLLNRTFIPYNVHLQYHLRACALNIGVAVIKFFLRKAQAG